VVKNKVKDALTCGFDSAHAVVTLEPQALYRSDGKPLLCIIPWSDIEGVVPVADESREMQAVAHPLVNWHVAATSQSFELSTAPPIRVGDVLPEFKGRIAADFARVR